MKKRTAVIVFMLLIMLTVPAQAIARMVSAYSSISFNGNTATCNVTIAVGLKDNVSAEIELWQGDNFVTSWKESSTGPLGFKETAQVTSGKSYTLMVNFEVNGVKQQPISSSGTCK